MEEYVISFDEIRGLLEEQQYQPDDIEELERAFEFAKKLHSGQYRVSEEPYIIHPMEVVSVGDVVDVHTWKKIGLFVWSVVLSCLSCALFLGFGLEVIFGRQYPGLISIIFFNNLTFTMALGCSFAKAALRGWPGWCRISGRPQSVWRTQS